MFNVKSDEIVYKNKNGIEYIQFKKLLDLNIKHAYTLKGEGIDFNVKGEKELECNKKLFDALEIDIETCTKPDRKSTRLNSSHRN